MRLRRARAGVEPYAGMNLVPIVDMALNLVLILLIMAPAMYLVRLPVKLPEAEASDSNTKDWIRLTLAPDGRLSVEGEILPSWEALPERLKRAIAEAGRDFVLLEVDREVPYQMTSRLLAELRRGVKVSRIGIATVPKNDTDKPR